MFDSEFFLHLPYINPHCFCQNCTGTYYIMIPSRSFCKMDEHLLLIDMIIYFVRWVPVYIMINNNNNMTVISGISLFLLMPLLCGSEFDPLCLCPSFLQQSLYQDVRQTRVSGSLRESAAHLSTSRLGWRTICGSKFKYVENKKNKKRLRFPLQTWVKKKVFKTNCPAI